MNITVKEISERLSRDADRVAKFLLPGGKEVKGDWCVGSTSGEPGDSLKVHLTGEHAGHWQDWADQSQKGDLLDLWAAVKGLVPPEAIKQAKAWLGITDGAFSAGAKRYTPAPDLKHLQEVSEGTNAMTWLTAKRKLSPAIVNRFKIQYDKTKKAIVFPCFAPDGKLINRSYRTVEKDVWQDKGCAPCLFGWHALSPESYKTRTVLLCEGQIDAASWTQLGVHALSIPNGSGQTWIEYEWDNLAAFDTIYISFDMDGAGQENATKTINRIGRERCLIVTLPKKDANDCLIGGSISEDAQEWIACAKAPALKNLVKAADLEQRLFQALVPKKEAFTLPFLRNCKRDHGYFPRPGEVTIWTGATSQGKSTFLNFFILSFLTFGMPVLVASMEAKAETVLRKMMASFFGREPSQEDVKEFLAEVGHLLIFADVVGYIGREQLLEMIRFSNRRFGVAHVIVDSLMRVDGLEEEYVQQGKFLNELQELAKHSDIHVHLVAHPRKMGEGDKPGKMDVKGSSLIPNNADNIVAVCRNAEKDKLRKEGELTPAQDRAMYDTEIRVEKQRETGWEGRFLLKFDPITFTYAPFGEPAVDKPKRTGED